MFPLKAKALARSTRRHPANDQGGSAAPADEPAWRDLASCRGLGPALFYAEEEDGEDVREAKALCGECSVRRQCLEQALAANERYGVWGGTTPRERRRLRRLHRKSA
ncbi:MAG TPA: WhiB family transcriptional regulator [Acidimicrobiia bacterium]|nr:WhiB family transcriptional regulator [Acidimicrobiia bacterium]